MTKAQLKRSREFEEAVYTFAKSLDLSAEVFFDRHVPDRDTGTLRQCDVWINAKFGGHWPMSILISCKQHHRKLNISDIGTFHNEVRSTGASTGVIYSTAGFTKSALEKARVNGLACCRLYQNEPADIPQSLWLESFVCKASIQLNLLTAISTPQLTVWNDLFDIRSSTHGESTVLDLVTTVFADGEEQSKREAAKNGSLPQDWATDLQFNVTGLEDALRVRIIGHWKLYRGRLEAHLLNGSYCFTNESYSGHLIGLPIDIQGAHPGEGWVEITDPTFILPLNRVIAILSKGNVGKALRENLGSRPLVDNIAS